MSTGYLQKHNLFPCIFLGSNIYLLWSFFYMCPNKRLVSMYPYNKICFRFCLLSSFSVGEMKRIYRGFKTECPTGLITEETFNGIYSRFFPLGGNVTSLFKNLYSVNYFDMYVFSILHQVSLKNPFKNLFNKHVFLVFK